MGVSDSEAEEVRSMIIRGDRRDVPGMVRVSFGLYNTFEDIDRLVSALREIAAGQYKGAYYQNIASGEFIPEGWDIQFEKYFTFQPD
jgi:hypothetical protein